MSFDWSHVTMEKFAATQKETPHVKQWPFRKEAVLHIVTLAPKVALLINPGWAHHAHSDEAAASKKGARRS